MPPEIDAQVKLAARIEQIELKLLGIEESLSKSQDRETREELKKLRTDYEATIDALKKELAARKKEDAPAPVPAGVPAPAPKKDPTFAEELGLE